MEIGPYILIDGKVYKKPFGKVNPKPGAWDRLRLVDKDGELLQKEIVVTWAGPGEVMVPTTRGHQMSVRYKDLGHTHYEVNEASITKLLASKQEAKKLAKDTAKLLVANKATQEDARAFGADVVGEANFSALAHALSSKHCTLEIARTPQEIAGELHYDVEAAAAFAAFLAAEFKDAAVVRIIVEAFKKDAQQG